MALGGVETGSMKAQEQAIVTGTIKNIGLKWILEASTAVMGSKVVATTVLEVNSVKIVADTVNK